MEKSLVFFNNRFVGIDELVLPVEERGFQFGDGVYEMLRVYNGIAYTLKEHLERLVNSSESILIDLPKKIDEIYSLIEDGINRLQMKEGTIYIQLTRGTSPRNHYFPEGTDANLTITFKNEIINFERKQKEGVFVFSFPDERWKNCYIKSICLLPNILAKEKARQKGGHEALLLHEGVVKEGATTNIFIVKDGVIKTPRADQSILNGITRQKVIKLLKTQGIPFSETLLTMEDIKIADEVILTSSTQELIPVVRVDDFVIGEGVPGNYYKTIQKLYHKDISMECNMGM
jgi:D-alanine transaminase